MILSTVLYIVEAGISLKTVLLVYDESTTFYSSHLHTLFYF